MVLLDKIASMLPWVIPRCEDRRQIESVWIQRRIVWYPVGYGTYRTIYSTFELINKNKRADIKKNNRWSTTSQIWKYYLILSCTVVNSTYLVTFSFLAWPRPTKKYGVVLWVDSKNNKILPWSSLLTKSGWGEGETVLLPSKTTSSSSGMMES